MSNDKPYDGGQLPEVLQSFAAELKTLAPRGDRLERERLMFLAGQASVDDGATLPGLRRQRGWAAAFAGMTAVAAALLVVVLTSLEGPTTSEREYAGLPPRVKRDVGRFQSEESSSQGISAATIFHENGLEEILAITESGTSDDGETKFESTGDLENPAPLTPASWEQLFDET